MEDYEGSLPIAREHAVSANDTLVYRSMIGHGLREVYSFDRHFDQLNGITRLPPE